jgi:hypothetical protein
VEIISEINLIHYNNNKDPITLTNPLLFQILIQIIIKIIIPKMTNSLIHKHSLIIQDIKTLETLLMTLILMEMTFNKDNFIPNVLFIKCLLTLIIPLLKYPFLYSIKKLFNLISHKMNGKILLFMPIIIIKNTLKNPTLIPLKDSEITLFIRPNRSTKNEPFKYKYLN